MILSSSWVSNHIFRCLSIVFLSAFSVSISHADDFEVKFRDSVGKFLNSLDDSQAKACLLPLDNTKARWQIRYTGGVRPGIQISSLS